MTKVSTNQDKYISIIGSGNIDVFAAPIKKDVFISGSLPVQSTKLSFGGDALNEAVILSRLGVKVEMISNIGNDKAGENILDFLKENKVDVSKVRIIDGLDSSINIVLVDEKGERYFITNPNSNLRKLSLDDIIPSLDKIGDIVSFAGMFISPLIGIKEMETLFKTIKSKGKTLCVDMTKRKNGETIEDIKCLLPYIDYIFPNEEEAALLTGIDNPIYNAKILVDNGVKCAVIKCGKNGCIIKTKEDEIVMPALKVKEVVDTTGAGDSFVAGFMYGLVNGLDNIQSGKLAIKCGALTVQKVGANSAITSIDDLKGALN